MKADVVVVGGGAAGLSAAIFAARQRPQAAICVLDGARRLGAKILVSGGGRCNVTNVRVTPEDYEGGSRHVVRRILAEFDERQTMRFFRELGVELYEDYAGKLFPRSDKARTVLDALLGEAQRLRIVIRTDSRVERVAQSDGAFAIEFRRAGQDERETILAGLCVLATGGKSLPKSGSDGAGYALATALGHTLERPVAALVPLLLGGELHAPLAGITLEAELTVRVEREKPVRRRGSLLFTHFGISGPVALDVSRFYERARDEGRAVHVTANFSPLPSAAAVEEFLLGAVAEQPRTALEALINDWMPARLADALLAESGVRADTVLAQLTREARRSVAAIVAEYPLPVRGTRGFNYAEVTAGGVRLNEVDPRTLESRRTPGLYLVGEILDVDGRIGGFNFQWAWSSGFVAGQAIARRLAEVPSS